MLTTRGYEHSAKNPKQKHAVLDTFINTDLIGGGKTMGVSTADHFVYDTHFCERVTQTSKKEHRFGMVMSVKITRPVRLKIRCVMETFYGVEITYDEAKIARDKRVIGLETLDVGEDINSR